MNYLIANCLVLIAGLGVFGFNLKIYTEMLKDKSQDRRASKDRA